MPKKKSTKLSKFAEGLAYNVGSIVVQQALKSEKTSGLERTKPKPKEEEKPNYFL